MIRICVIVYCDTEGCVASTEATAVASPAEDLEGLEFRDVQVEDGPNGEPTMWGRGVSGVHCPEHAPKEGHEKA